MRRVHKCVAPVLLFPTGTQPDRIIPLVPGVAIITHYATLVYFDVDERTLRGTSRTERQRHTDYTKNLR